MSLPRDAEEIAKLFHEHNLSTKKKQNDLLELASLLIEREKNVEAREKEIEKREKEIEIREKEIEIREKAIEKQERKRVEDA